MTIINQEALITRAENLSTHNGIRMLLVSLPSGSNPVEATLELYFYNTKALNYLQSIGPDDLTAINSAFNITGGHRIIAGPLDGQVKVTKIEAVAGKPQLKLTVAPVGDYSTYTLSLDYTKFDIDPVLSEIKFKFRPGCFSVDCAPDWEPSLAAQKQPEIDYLAKDFESFKHLYISAMMDRVPGWQPTSEADLDMTLLELFSVQADELSDYQDRVMNEATISSARKRVSLTRHARQMDYHVHQGHQASTLLIVKLKAGQSYDEPNLFPKGFTVWTGAEVPKEESQYFASKEEAYMLDLLNDMELYTWQGVKPSLAAGSTSADILLSLTSEASVKEVVDWINEGKIKRLVIQEHQNPETGQSAGLDPTRRQLLRLISAEAKLDPMTGQWFVYVKWDDRDKLKRNYCFTVRCKEGAVEHISFFHGNLIDVYHGNPKQLIFIPPGTPMTQSNQRYFEQTEKWGTLCYLNNDDRLSYQYTPPGNEENPLSTLSVSVDSGEVQTWSEAISFIHSQEDYEEYIVETDELQQSVIRFGNGVNGKRLADDAIVTCDYQIGQGREGNIGRDMLIFYDTTASDYAAVASCWNPFDVTNGIDPEPVGEIVRRMQEAYNARQLRAITLKDYEARAEELPDINKAKAQYAWSGSWRIIRVALDPKGTEELPQEVFRKVSRHLDAVRLIGDDLELRLPRFVPLDIKIDICIHPDYWAQDIQYILEQEFSNGYTPDGLPAFFHPDKWTFGQSLYASQILGSIKKIKGIDFVKSISMTKWDHPSGIHQDYIEVDIDEVITVANDRDHMEKGFIDFDVKGGRR